MKPMKNKTKAIFVKLNIAMSIILALTVAVIFIAFYDTSKGVLAYAPRLVLGLVSAAALAVAVIPSLKDSREDLCRPVGKAGMALSAVSLLGAVSSALSAARFLGENGDGLLPAIVTTFSFRRVSVTLFGKTVKIFSFGGDVPTVFGAFGFIFLVVFAVYFLLGIFGRRVKALPVFGALGNILLIFAIYFTRSRAMTDTLRDMAMLIPAFSLVFILFEMKQDHGVCTKHDSSISIGLTFPVFAAAIGLIIYYLVCFFGGHATEFTPKLSEILFVFSAAVLAYRRFFLGLIPAEKEEVPDTAEEPDEADETDETDRNSETSENKPENA